ncbi:MAG: hypothetical protein M3297_06775, partial [Thermoproteota archaeon]|nr:hypothetical protein [Thermoproteota archaeon]
MDFSRGVRWNIMLTEYNSYRNNPKPNGKDRELKVNEFRMYIHGPFATNIYVDVRQIEELRTRTPFSESEIQILKSIKKRPKAKEKIYKQVNGNISDVSTTIENLKLKGFVKPITKRTISFSHMERLSITPEALEKYKRSSIDDNNCINDRSLEDFKQKIKMGTEIDNYKLRHSFFGQDEAGSFFSQEDLPVLLEVVSIKDFFEDLSNSCRDLNKLEFKRNTVYFYASGVGIFSSQVTVKIDKDVDITKIKGKLEEKVKEAIQDLFKSEISKIIQNFVSHAPAHLKLVRRIFDINSSKVGKLAWLHKIYWFYGDQFFNDNADGIGALNFEMRREFNNLLEQALEDTLPVEDRYVYYGWGRSLILTRNNNPDTEEWINKIANLVEIGQYSCFGHILLDYYLTKKIYDLTVDEPIIEQQSKILIKKIEDLDTIRSASITYLEQFRSGINIILQCDQPSLVDKLEKQWRVEQLEKNIHNKLHSVEKERSSREQSILTDKQDRLNKTAFIFTIISLASVMAAVVTLSPLKSIFNENTHGFEMTSQLSFVM